MASQRAPTLLSRIYHTTHPQHPHKRQMAPKTTTATTNAAPDADTDGTEPQALREVLEGLAVSQRPPRNHANPNAAAGSDDAANEAEEAHAFWDTQPVPRLGEDTTEIDRASMGPIDPPDVERVRARRTTCQRASSGRTST